MPDGSHPVLIHPDHPLSDIHCHYMEECSHRKNHLLMLDYNKTTHTLYRYIHIHPPDCPHLTDVDNRMVLQQNISCQLRTTRHPHLHMVPHPAHWIKQSSSYKFLSEKNPFLPYPYMYW